MSNSTKEQKDDPERFRLISIALICTMVTGLVALLHWQFVPLRDAENRAQDWLASLGRMTPANPNLVLIGIDEPTYAEQILDSEAEADPVLAVLQQQDFPWSRLVWAALIERLAEAGARAIVLDLVFAAPGEGDDALSEALRKHQDKVVIGSTIRVDELQGGGTITSILAPHEGLLGGEGDQPAALDDRVGYVNAWPDGGDGGVLRRARFRLANHEIDNAINADPDVVIESLAARVLSKIGEIEHIPTELEPVRFRYTAPPDAGFPAHRLGDLLWQSTWQANYQSGEFFRDKVVLIGPTAQIFGDRHRTPFTVPTTQMRGPEIHLNIINAALHDEFLTELPFAGQVILILVFGGLATLVSLTIHSPPRRLAALVGLSALGFFAGQALYNHANLVVVLVGPFLALNGSGAVAMTFDIVFERFRRAKLRHTMGLYFSPRVLDAVLADPGSMDPRQADVTLLITDLRNSTPLAEMLGPTGMFNLLNRVFEAQTEAIMSEQGNLEHFLGDQFLSYWGAPQSQPDGADLALKAALKLIPAMQEVRDSLTPEVKALFGYGVALHSGSVLVGNKGSSKRLDYGLVGDTVNEAARIEALTKYYNLKLLTSQETLNQLSSPPVHRLIDRVIVKGKSTPVGLLELENPCTPSNYEELCRRYETAYREYEQGRFSEAGKEFAALATAFEDGPSAVLANRCSELKAQPRDDWKGVWRMDSK